MGNPKIIYFPNPLLQKLVTPNDIGAAPWFFQNGVSSVSNFATAPDGTLRAAKLIKGSVVTSGAVLQSIPNADGVSIYTFWFWVKAGNTSNCDFGIYDATAGSFPAASGVGILIGPGVAVVGTGGGACHITGLLTTDWTLVYMTIPVVTAGHVQSAYIYPGGAADATSGHFVLASFAGLDAAGGPVVLSFSYPPVAKPGIDERNVIRHDAITTSGTRQSIWERTEIFRNLQMDFVPQSDLNAWNSFLAAVEQGGLFYYVPDLSLNPFNVLLLEDMIWSPQRIFFGFAKFKMKTRVIA